MNNNFDQKNQRPMRDRGFGGGQKQRRSAISPRERAIAVEKIRAERLRKKRRRKMLFDRITATLVFAILGAAITLAAISAYVFFNYKSYDKVEKKSISLSFGEKEPEQLKDDYYLFRNGIYYVSLSKISSNLPMTIHGNAESMTVSFDDGSYASFNVGERSVDICGNKALLCAPTYFEGGQFFVPIDFFKDNFRGVDISYPTKRGGGGIKMTFSKDFALNASVQNKSESIPFGSVSHLFEEPAPLFKADLSAYEMYMNPENKDEYLTLVSTKSMLSADYVPTDLVDIVDTRKDGRKTQQMRLYAEKALEAMFIEMRANGFTDVSVTSGYRSYSYQQTLFNNEVAAFGGDAERAAKSVAIPGSSEHQSGLCVDMHNLSSASEAFSQQAAYKWLYSNCANFGFILRFPKDKTDITGIVFEPWHYRYVGRYHAQKIMGSGLCLEEYLETLG